MLDISIDRSDGALVMRLRGEADLHSRPLLIVALEHSLETPEPTVVFDLRGLEFLDAAALRQLSATAATVEAQGRRAVLRDPRPIVRRLIEIAGTEVDLTIEMSPTPLRLVSGEDLDGTVSA